MRRKALKKDFDTSEVQSIAFNFADHWSDEAWEQYGAPGDVHGDVAARLDAADPGIVLDVGCGSGTLSGALKARCFGLDRSIEQLKQGPTGTVIGDLEVLPFADETFGAAATLYTLYFFEDVSAVAAEIGRVIKPGGLFATCAPSRFDSPEVAHLAPRDDIDAFASEDIEELLNERFEDVEMNEWRFPFIELKTLEAARDYVHFFYFPRFSVAEAEEHASTLGLPLKITKIGAWGVGRKPG